MTPWHHITMTPWHHDTNTKWHHDTMTPWHQHKMTPWHHASITPWHHDISSSRLFPGEDPRHLLQLHQHQTDILLVQQGDRPINCTVGGCCIPKHFTQANFITPLNQPHITVLNQTTYQSTEPHITVSQHWFTLHITAPDITILNHSAYHSPEPHCISHYWTKLQDALFSRPGGSQGLLYKQPRH